MNRKYLIFAAFMFMTMNNYTMIAQAKQWLYKQTWYKPVLGQSKTTSPFPQTQITPSTRPTEPTTLQTSMNNFLGAFSSTLKRLVTPKQYMPQPRPKITYETSAQNRLRELAEQQQKPSDNSWSAWFGLGQNKKAISRGAAQTKERLQTSIDQAGSNPLVQKRLVELSKHEQPAITELEDIKIMTNPEEGAKGQLVVRMPDPRYIAHERTIVQDTEDARKQLISDAKAFEHNSALLDQSITLNKKWLKAKQLYNAAKETNNENAMERFENILSAINKKRELLHQAKTTMPYK